MFCRRFVTKSATTWHFIILVNVLRYTCFKTVIKKSNRSAGLAEKRKAMSITHRIIELLDKCNNDTCLAHPIAKCDSGFYGDIISKWIKDRRFNKSDVANNMNLNPRTLDYILSKNDKRYRHIGFYETLRLAIVLNLSLSESLELLHVCNYSINTEYVRDRVILEILRTPHRDIFEMDERLDCLLALEDNEPFNTNEYDFLVLFNYLASHSLKDNHDSNYY